MKKPVPVSHPTKPTPGFDVWTGGTGGPLKPDFGLSGAVPPVDKVFPPSFRVAERS
jgi:hypothetical protein